MFRISTDPCHFKWVLACPPYEYSILGTQRSESLIGSQLLHPVHSFSSTNQSHSRQDSRSKTGAVLTTMCCLDVEDISWKKQQFSLISVTCGQTKDGCFPTEAITSVRLIYPSSNFLSRGQIIALFIASVS